MAYVTKRKKEFSKLMGEGAKFVLDDAIDILKKCPDVKFDQTIELSFKMGVDPKKADQQIRSTVALPCGSGKNVRVLVFAKGENIDIAKKAGAEFAGGKELLDKVKGGWTDFDVVVATPDMMAEVGKLGKVLGPRGLMPSPKAGTITSDVKKAVSELKAGKIEFKVDKSSSINVIAGKLSFEKSDILKNVEAIVQAIVKVKPPGVKGSYVKSFYISSTMGPGLDIDLHSIGSFVS